MNHASERPPPLPPLRTLATTSARCVAGAHPIRRRATPPECVCTARAGVAAQWPAGASFRHHCNISRYPLISGSEERLDPRKKPILVVVLRVPRYLSTLSTGCASVACSAAHELYEYPVTAGRRFGSPSPRPFPRAGCWTRNARARIRPSTSHRSGRLSAAVCCWAARDLQCLLVRGPHVRVVVPELRGQPRESLACWRARAQRWREPTSATDYVLRRALLQDAGVNTGPSKATQGCR